MFNKKYQKKYIRFLSKLKEVMNNKEKKDSEKILIVKNLINAEQILELLGMNDNPSFEELYKKRIELALNRIEKMKEDNNIKSIDFVYIEAVLKGMTEDE